MNFIPYSMIKTREYISSEISKGRRGHHIYVAERELCNLLKPYNELSDNQKMAFDNEMVERLKQLDVIN